MKTYCKVFPKTLVSLRLSKDWTQQQLVNNAIGKHGGVSSRTIKRIERSEEPCQCTTRIALSLSAALGVSIDDLRNPIHPMIYDVGGDVLLDLSGDPDPATIREGTEQIIELIERRRRLIALGG